MDRTLTPLPRLMTPMEVANETGLPKQGILVAAREALLPCVRLGRRVLFDRGSVLEWIRSGGKSFPGGWKREAD